MLLFIKRQKFIFVQSHGGSSPTIRRIRRHDYNLDNFQFKRVGKNSNTTYSDTTKL